MTSAVDSTVSKNGQFFKEGAVKAGSRVTFLVHTLIPKNAVGYKCDGTNFSISFSGPQQLQTTLPDVGVVNINIKKDVTGKFEKGAITFTNDSVQYAAQVAIFSVSGSIKKVSNSGKEDVTIDGGFLKSTTRSYAEVMSTLAEYPLKKVESKDEGKREKS